MPVKKQHGRYCVVKGGKIVGKYSTKSAATKADKPTKKPAPAKKPSKSSKKAQGN